jgi:hypothetical protein
MLSDLKRPLANSYYVKPTKFYVAKEETAQIRLEWAMKYNGMPIELWKRVLLDR